MLRFLRGTIDWAGILEGTHPCKDIGNHWTIPCACACSKRTVQQQPPPQVLRFSHGRGERETSDWWYTARDHGKGTDGRRSDVSPVVSFPPSFARISRETSGYEAGTTTKSNLPSTQKIELQLIVRASVSHVIPVKKNKENDFSMEFSTSYKSREIDRSEGFHRIRSIFGAAFDATSPPFFSTLVLLRYKQCFGFA